MYERPHRTRSDLVTPHSLPALLTSGEVAALLRTTRRAVYAMVERGQLPGVVRLGRREVLSNPEMSLKRIDEPDMSGSRVNRPE